MMPSSHAPSAPQRIFDPRHIALHRLRAHRRGGHPFLFDEAMQGMAERLETVTRHFARGQSIGPRCEALHRFAENWQQGNFDTTEQLLPAGEKGKYNLAVSLLTLHQLNDLPGALRQIRERLQPGGMFLATLFGGDSLHELREALEAGDIAAGRAPAQRVAPFAEVQPLGDLLRRAGFTHAVAERERTTIKYRDLATLFADLRDMGESGNLATHTPLSRTALIAALGHYGEHNRTAEGKYSVTCDILYLTGWVPEKPEKIVIPR